MSHPSRVTAAPPRGGILEPIRIEGEMTIYTAAACNTRLLSELVSRAGHEAAIDLSRVTEIDTAGLQIILMARRLAGARGGAITLIDPSPPVRELLELCGLQGLIGAGGAAS